MITLDRLVNVLGGYGVRLHHGPVHRSAELCSVALPEAVGGRVVSGDVLLAMGAGTAAEALKWARAAHAVVVLVRGDGVAPVDDETDVAVMVVDAQSPWSALAAIVYGLVLEGRETASGRGPTDLFALADSLAARIGGPVLLVGSRAEVLAYARVTQQVDPAHERTILARQLPDEVHQFFSGAGVFRHLERSDEPLYVAADTATGIGGRMIVAVRAGHLLVGSVWVVCPSPLTGGALTALVTGADTVALHLLRSRASADLERQVESESVTQLLDGAADAATLASRLGLPQERSSAACRSSGPSMRTANTRR